MSGSNNERDSISDAHAQARGGGGGGGGTRRKHDRPHLDREESQVPTHLPLYLANIRKSARRRRGSLPDQFKAHLIGWKWNPYSFNTKPDFLDYTCDRTSYKELSVRNYSCWLFNGGKITPFLFSADRRLETFNCMWRVVAGRGPTQCGAADRLARRRRRRLGLRRALPPAAAAAAAASPAREPGADKRRLADDYVDTGMESLETSINYWEDALAAFSLGARGGVSGTLALTSPEEAEFCREIQDLLQDAYMLQERCELLFLDQRSVLFRSESGGGGGGEDEPDSIILGGRRQRLLSTHTASSRHTRREHHSSAESFASAEDQVADLREFDDFTENLPELEHLELYQLALKQLDDGIPYRTLRTDVVHCATDAEFLCKLHCLRLALQLVFKDAAVWAWFVDAGRQVLTDMLLFADKEPKEFLVAYEEMVSWTSDPANWTTIENELCSKGVKVLTFYDVVLDFILLDAFEDLAAPPSSVLAVVRNRWLSDGFKESALTTAVWSVIKAKRRYLQYPDGFMAHFYSISEHLLPVLVWGFLGPRERLREVCQNFQSEIVGFVTDLFDFQKCRYTTVEDLAADILQHARARAANITDKLAERI
ncbi:unnamed protein product [Plutella xylostella]|uniref:(diamondback moth) hypothetical protein n=1 Tax=Plutella xylostella TaxID=51655 RepID=A0A8S4DGP8_PLUXY|nr:unnamed protein product [Plutella xylostella]